MLPKTRKIAEELGIVSGELAVKSKVDIVLEYLKNTYFIHDHAEIEKLVGHSSYVWDKKAGIFRYNDSRRSPVIRAFRLYLDEKTKSFTHPNIDAVVRIAAKKRGEAVEDGKVEQLKNKVWYDAKKFKNMGSESLYFGKPEDAAYTSEDIIEAGFMFHSCTSFALFAHYLLREAGVRSKAQHLKKLNRKDDIGGHTIVEYIGDNGLLKKCDPKWQMLPEFFKGLPEERIRFENEPGYYVHGVSREEDEKGNKIPKRYEFFKTLAE